MEEKVDKKYYAFISYSHKDEEWAKWLQHEFEHYHLPTTLNGLPNVPDNFRPIFRDVDELSGGELKPQIFKALRESIYLVVVCSPNSARSEYVNEEIREFVKINKNNIGNIFPFIVEGIPNCVDNPLAECFPKALKQLPSDIIAGDATKHGREHAFVKVLSGTLKNTDIRFSMIWNQFERDRIEAERRERERRNRLLLLESRYLSEKALDVSDTDSRLARMLILNALPKNLNDPNDRPYCPEAEGALRTLHNFRSSIFKHNTCVSDFKHSPKSGKAASASKDGTIKIWDIERGALLHEKVAHEAGVTRVSYSNNGKLIATWGKDNCIKLWDADMMALKLCIATDINEPVNRLLFTRDDASLITLSNKGDLKFWNVSDGLLTYGTKVDNSNDMAIDRTGQRLAFATLNFSICIFDIKERVIVKRIVKAHSESLTSIDFNPDGTRILSGAYDGKFKVWDWAKGIAVLEKNSGKVEGAYAPIVHTARYSPNGKWIVTATSDFMIKTWNAATGELGKYRATEYGDHIWSAEYSHDGSYILSAHEAGTAKLWELKSHRYKIVGRAMFIPFDPKTSSDQYTLRIEANDILIVNLTDGSTQVALKGHEANVISAIFNHDGTKIASSAYDGTIRIWDVNTGTLSKVLTGHTSPVRNLSFSHDGSQLMTASKKEIKVWSVEHHLQIGQDITFFEDIYFAQFTENGEGIMVETENDYDIIYDWKPLDKLIAQTREELEGREFTEEEKKKYYLE